MTGLRPLPGWAGDVLDGFEVGFADQDRREHRVRLLDAWWVRFERCLPARRFPSYQGQKHFPRRWWSATTGGHVGYESWLERDHLMVLDHEVKHAHDRVFLRRL